MAVDTPAAPVVHAAAYPDLFRQYVAWGVEHLVHEVQTTTDHLPAAVREQAWTLLSFGLGQSDAWVATRALLLALTPFMEHEGWWREWVPYLERGIEQSRHWGEPATEAELSLRLGVLHRSLANYAEARTWLLASAERFGDLGDQRNRARAFNRLAWLARLQGRIQETQQWVAAALASPQLDETERATSYSILGSLAFDERAWATAATYFQKTLALRQCQSDKRMLAWAFNDLAFAQYEQKKYEDAIFNYQEALAILATLPATEHHQAVVRINLGNLYLSVSQPEAALECYAQVQPILQQTQDERRLAMLYNNQGIAFRKLKQWEYARDSLIASIERWQRIDNVEFLVDTLNELGLVYVEMGVLADAKTTFQHALQELHRIESDIVRTDYHQLISEHLQQVLRR